MSKKMLVAYFTWSNGNTERIAEELAQATDADLLRIETAQPYPDDYQQTVDQGKREVDEGFEPELEAFDLDPADYDIVAVGTPTWWYTMAPAVKSFFSTASLAGKTVVPFMTCAGWNGTVIDDMEDAAKAAGAQTAHPLEITFDRNGGSKLVSSESAIKSWIADVKDLLD